MKARPSQASAAASPSLGSCSSTWTTDRRLPPAGLPEPPGAARQPRAEDCPKCQALAALLGVFNRATASPAARHRRSSPARVRSARPCQLWAHRRTQLRIPSSRSRLSAVATARSHTGFWVAISPSARIAASVRRGAPCIIESHRRKRGNRRPVCGVTRGTVALPWSSGSLYHSRHRWKC
jgi:hypothetical protein